MQRPRVGLGHERAVLRVQDVTLRELLVHPVLHHPGGGVITEQIVDGGRHLECALVAVPAHRGHPPRIDHAGAKHPRGLLRQRAGADRVGSGVVADIGGRCLARERPHGGHHAAVILEVVVGVGDVVFTGVGILGGHRNTPVLAVHVVDRLAAIQVAPVGESAPGGVHLGEVGVVAPAAAVDQLQQPGAVGSRFGSENPCGGSPLISVVGQIRLGVRAHVVVLGGLVEVGDQPHRVIEHGHHMREGITEKAGDPYRHVDARAAQLGRLHGRQVDDPPRGVVPYRPNPQQRKHFGDVVAGRAHRRGAPHRQPHRPRPPPMLIAVARQQRIGQCHTGFPRQPGRHRLGIHGVEVAPGG
ncbi:Uncharacterised protein [Mycobacterium tuberculosis]|nr:Uncharacterised protein [Mycobacterium tuberculosis]